MDQIKPYPLYFQKEPGVCSTARHTDGYCHPSSCSNSHCSLIFQEQFPICLIPYPSYTLCPVPFLFVSRELRFTFQVWAKLSLHPQDSSPRLLPSSDFSSYSPVPVPPHLDCWLFCSLWTEKPHQCRECVLFIAECPTHQSLHDTYWMSEYVCHNAPSLLIRWVILLIVTPPSKQSWTFIQ